MAIPAAKGAKAPVVADPEVDPGFVPVRIQSEEPSGDYLLSWPSGRALKIPGRFDRDSLRRLLSVLEGAR